MGEILGVIGWDCDKCGRVILESYPHCKLDNEIYCWDCSFIVKLITESEYLKYRGFHADGFHAECIDGKIKIWEDD